MTGETSPGSGTIASRRPGRWGYPPPRRIDQLNHALQSRIAIEQAKGVVAPTVRTRHRPAFACLCHYARHKNRLLTDVAKAVIDGTVKPDLPHRV